VRNPKSHTNYHYLGLAHMQDLAKGYADQTSQLKLQVIFFYVLLRVLTSYI
jgi:hypothetical protein